MEKEIMDIILNAGDARSKCLLAFREARKGNFEQAEEHLTSANTSMLLAHKVQTNLIQREVAGEKQTITLLMVHAQDHLMTAMSMRDMVIEFIEYAKDLQEKVRSIESRLM